MTWLTRFNPTPAFPPYSGPYKVGSVDVEIPTAQLANPTNSGGPDSGLTTVSFRIFYPTKDGSEGKGARWIPSPQKDVVSAYAKFLGASNALAGLFAYVKFIYG